MRLKIPQYIFVLSIMAHFRHFKSFDWLMFLMKLKPKIAK